MTKLHRVFAALLSAPALMVPSAGVFAQPPDAAPVALPRDLCLTNACADRPAAVAKPKTVPEAIAVGDGVRVRELGGTAQDVLAAVTRWMELDYLEKGSSEANVRSLESERREYQHYADRSFGEFVFQPLSFVAMREGDGLPMPGGGMLKASFVIQRRSASGCVELIVVHENGRGVPSTNICSR